MHKTTVGPREEQRLKGVLGHCIQRADARAMYACARHDEAERVFAALRALAEPAGVQVDLQGRLLRFPNGATLCVTACEDASGAHRFSGQRFDWIDYAERDGWPPADLRERLRSRIQ